MLSSCACAQINATVRGKRLCEDEVSYDGIGSAMDAIAAAYNNASLLRAHMDPEWMFSSKCLLQKPSSLF